MLDLLLTPVSAMINSPVRNSMNSSRAASSPSDLDAQKVSWVSASGKRCLLELNGYCAAVLVLRPLERKSAWRLYWSLSSSRWVYRAEAHH